MSINPNSYHGHDILNLIMEASPAFTMTTLKAYVEQHFGANATFYTCKLQNLSIDALLEFLISREKVIVDGDLLRTNVANMCQH